MWILGLKGLIFSDFDSLAREPSVAGYLRNQLGTTLFTDDLRESSHSRCSS